MYWWPIPVTVALICVSALPLALWALGWSLPEQGSEECEAEFNEAIW